jgi:TonB family protein
MIPRQREPLGWPLRRWLLVIAVIFIVQFGFITWLGQPAVEMQAHLPRRVPVIALLAGGRETDIPGVYNPTILVLANRRGFSGDAWLQIEPPRNPTREWTEPPRPLPATVEQFGGTLNAFVQSNLFQRLEVARKPAPTIGEYFTGEILAQSTFSLEGDAARRRLLSDFKLDSKPATETLSNSVVQIAIDAGGNVFSAVLTGKCGSPEADADALRLARTARFEPLVRDGPDRPPLSRPTLDWGWMVFRWNTAPVPSTNAVPSQ